MTPDLLAKTEMPSHLVHRAGELLRILPKNNAAGTFLLDIGARDGYISKLLTEYYTTVTALDLEPPAISHPRIVPVGGDVTDLAFPDGAFDCVFCSEVLEHVAELEKACREIARVARHNIVIGVPFQQDTRAERTTCRTCGKTNPPWGHINSFTEQRLLQLFPQFDVITKSLVAGPPWSRTNAISAFLMDIAGNPWGPYDQLEPCIYCGAKLVPPANRSLPSKILSLVARKINEAQSVFQAPGATWLHLALVKRPQARTGGYEGGQL